MGKVRVMVVEDEGLVALSLERTLMDLGYEVTAVTSSGEEALQRARESRPDIVLMDIRLKGGMDGIEAACRIRGELDLPIIFLTAYSDRETIERAKTAEAFGYLIKPFEDRELLTTIETAIREHGAGRAS